MTDITKAFAAARGACDHVERMHRLDNTASFFSACVKTVEKCRDLLAALDAQEPLGYIWLGSVDALTEAGGYAFETALIWRKPTGQAGVPIYLAPPAQPVPDWLPQPGEPEYVGDAGPVSDDDFVDLDDPDVLAEFDRKIAEAHAEIERRGYERGLKDARIEMGVVLAAKAHPAPVAVPADGYTVDAVAWEEFIGDWQQYIAGDPKMPFFRVREGLVAVIDSAKPAPVAAPEGLVQVLRELRADALAMKDNPHKGDMVFRYGVNGGIDVVVARIDALLAASPGVKS